jgi:hypothetical protein
MTMGGVATLMARRQEAIDLEDEASSLAYVAMGVNLAGHFTR